MELEAAIERAKAIRELYALHEANTYGRSWSISDLMLGFVGDVGELSQLVGAANGVRNFDNDLKEALGHELADCLWSVLVLANELDVDIVDAFETTMNKLETQLTS